MLCFLALSVILFTTLLRVVPVATTDPASSKGPGFNCRNAFISDAEVTNALIISKMRNKNLPFPKKYDGPGYKEDGLLMYPVLTHRAHDSKNSPVVYYYVVYQNPGHVKGVFASTQYNKHVQCLRITDLPHTSPGSDSNPSPLHIDGVIKGIQCGNDLIDEELIVSKIMNAPEMVQNKRGGYTLFPGSIPGLEGPHLMWPLIDMRYLGARERDLPQTSNYLITDQFGSFVQVSSRSFRGNYHRCNVLVELPNDPYPTLTKTNDGDLIEGFLCDIFFDDDYLSKCIAYVQNHKYTRSIYPMITYMGKSLGDVYLWPIFADKQIGSPGYSTRYYLLMNSRFQKLGVVRRVRDIGYKNCERSSIHSSQEPEKSDFVCDGKTIANAELTRLVEQACYRMTENTPYPKIYQGPSFDVIGPYLVTMPNLKRKRRGDVKTCHAVMTHDCKLAGALVVVNNNLQKCTRADKPIPEEPSQVPIRVLPRDLQHLPFIDIT